MKKTSLLLTLLLIVTLLVACSGENNDSKTSEGLDKGVQEDSGKQDDQKKELTKLVVGATPSPHAEILEVIKPTLLENGVELEIKEFTDYVTPNIALNDGSLDANFFQHEPYLNDFNEKNKMNLQSVMKIHIEPMGLYSQKYTSLDDLVDGAKIAIPNDSTNEGRSLLLLQANGLIELKDPEGLAQTPVDISVNKKNIEFIEIEAATLPRTLADVDMAVINTNFALEADLNPIKDAIIMEDANSPYANIIATREDNKTDENIVKLLDALQTDQVKEFIETKYKGAIVPVF